MISINMKPRKTKGIDTEASDNKVTVEPVMISVDLQPDMLFLADAFRLDTKSRLLLTAFDARTMEDFVMMSNDDFELMVITATRAGYDLAPLQQRKIFILLDWVRNLVKEESVLVRNRFSRRSTVTEKDIEECYGDVSLIPLNWKNRFQADLPELKNRLLELGETNRTSGLMLLFKNLRWVFCYST